MSSKSTISISFKIEDGAEGLKKMSIDADSLKKALSSTVKVADDLKKPFINFASLSTGIIAVQGVIQNFQSALRGLTDAYAVQVQAETQLENSMRNTMSATDAEIQSIKDLCSAQQELGVIGDEVQLAGAQKLATFLSEKNSLAALIPVMNDVVAKQNGFNATGENAATVAAAIGKAISGQTAALGKMGISFSDAQKEVLKYGNEQERVALLIDVITAKVGGQNQALAQTPFGAVKQLSNNLGDIKEQLGAVAVKVQPALDWSASTTIALGGVTKLIGGIKALNTSMKGATGAAKALKYSIRGLMIASGIGIAWMALSSVMEYFAGKSDEARKKTEELAQVQAKYAVEVRDIGDKVGKYSDAEISRLDRLYKSATDETKSRKERIKAAKELQSIYPDYFRNMSAEDIALGKAKKGYDELTNSIMKNARVKAAADKIVENEAQANTLKRDRDKLEDERRELYKKVAETKQKYDDASARSKADHSPEKLRSSGVQLSGNSLLTQADADALHYRKELAALQEQTRNTSEGIANLNQKISDTYKANDDLKADYGVTDDDLNAASGIRPISFLPESTVKVEPVIPAGSLAEINKQISNIKAQIELAVSPESGVALQAQLDALESRKRQIEFLYKFPDFKPNEIPGIGGELLSTPEYVKEIKVPGFYAITKMVKPDIKELNAEVQLMKEHFDEFQQSGVAAGGNIGEAFGALGGSLTSIGGLLDETTQKWMSYVGQVLQTIPQLIEAITALAASKAAASAAETPVVGWMLIGTAIASTLGAMAAIPKFADGGIISGPTLGLIGEYAGASNNPEVVAPLDKLRSLITPAGGGIDAGKVEFVIDGRVLRGVLRRVDNLSNRS